METTINLKVLGRHIQEARNRRGLTQKKVASVIGVSNSYVSRLETGAAQMSMYRFFSIAVCLQTAPSILLAGCCPEVADCDEQNISPEKKRMHELIEQASVPTLKIMCAVCDTLASTINSIK